MSLNKIGYVEAEIKERLRIFYNTRVQDKEKTLYIYVTYNEKVKDSELCKQKISNIYETIKENYSDYEKVYHDWLDFACQQHGSAEGRAIIYVNNNVEDARKKYLIKSKIYIELEKEHDMVKKMFSEALFLRVHSEVIEEYAVHKMILFSKCVSISGANTWKYNHELERSVDISATKEARFIMSELLAKKSIDRIVREALNQNIISNEISNACFNSFLHAWTIKGKFAVAHWLEPRKWMSMARKKLWQGVTMYHVRAKDVIGGKSIENLTEAQQIVMHMYNEYASSVLNKIVEDRRMLVLTAKRSLYKIKDWSILTDIMHYVFDVEIQCMSNGDILNKVIDKVRFYKATRYIIEIAKQTINVLSLVRYLNLQSKVQQSKNGNLIIRLKEVRYHAIQPLIKEIAKNITFLIITKGCIEKREKIKYKVFKTLGIKKTNELITIFRSNEPVSCVYKGKNNDSGIQFYINGIGVNIWKEQTKLNNKELSKLKNTTYNKNPFEIITGDNYKN